MNADDGDGGCGGGVIVILVVVALASNRPVSLLSDPCYKLLILPACFNLSTSLLNQACHYLSCTGLFELAETTCSKLVDDKF